jgi:hypothetical protein
MRLCFELYKFVLSIILVLDMLLNLNNLILKYLKICNNNSFLEFTDVRAKSPKVFLLIVKL